MHKTLYIYDNLEKDSEGYLKNSKDWNVFIAKEIAKQENIQLNDHHWVIIHFVRSFYIQFNITPSMRMLICSLQKKIKNINSIYLFHLFPNGPAKQASKIAGIPKPVNCL